jgi:ribosome-associated toxin RatA of RatAB toxin-antitoxin module
VDRVEVSTVVYLPPEEVYEFLVDFPRYADYSKYLERVKRDGDGSPGTRYALRFSWWKITYTAHTRVTDADPPNRIDWEVIKDMNAHGHWAVEEEPDLAPEDAETACRVTLRVEFEPGSVKVGNIGLPSFVSLSWLVEKVKPLIQEEAERVVERIVADIEGESRPVELTVHATPDSM